MTESKIYPLSQICMMYYGKWGRKDYSYWKRLKIDQIFQDIKLWHKKMSINLGKNLKITDFWGVRINLFLSEIECATFTQGASKLFNLT